MALIKLNKIPLLNTPPYGLKHIDPNSTHGSYLSKQYALNKRHAPNSSGMAAIEHYRVSVLRRITSIRK